MKASIKLLDVVFYKCHYSFIVLYMYSPSRAARNERRKTICHCRPNGGTKAGHAQGQWQPIVIIFTLLLLIVVTLILYYIITLQLVRVAC